MNVVWSSDENYAQHLAVSMLSLLESNRTAMELNCYIISNNISDASQKKLEELAARYGRRISWIDFEPFKQRLELNMAWPISISSYARLFLQEMLPESVSRVLYLDCDTVVCSSLEPLFELDLKGSCVGGVRDFITRDLKKAIGLKEDSDYINAGILLIDLAGWRREHMLEQFLAYIDSQNGKVIHHDQGVVNHCLNERLCILPPKYNAMTPLFTLSYPALQKLWGSYYTSAARAEALAEPVIIHFTPGFTCQVWDVKCTHPHRARYLQHLDQTPWKGCLTDRKIPLKHRLLNWLALHMTGIYASIVR